MAKLLNVFMIKEGVMDNVRGALGAKSYNKPVPPSPDPTDPDDPSVGKKHRDFVDYATKVAHAPPVKESDEGYQDEENPAHPAFSGDKGMKIPVEMSVLDWREVVQCLREHGNDELADEVEYQTSHY